MISGSQWEPSVFQGRVQSLLDEHLGDQGGRLGDLGPDAARLVDAARGAVRGGKRFRAMFCFWGFRAVRDPGGEREETSLLRAAAALEMLHASALVHDDLMDASDTRRGRPSVHRSFGGHHLAEGWRGDAEQYGAAAAVLLGDLLLSWSDELLRNCGLADDVVLRALRWFDTTRSEVIAGQFLDVSAQARGDADVEQSMRVLRYKSAKYSVERPLHIGAALAGASPSTVEALSAYGLPLGEAFQLRDDLLGVFGDPEVTGKPAGDDLSEGKRTVLVALALEGSSADDAQRLDAALGHPLSGREVAELQRLIERSGAHAEVESRIEKLTAESLAAVESAAIAEEARPILRDLATAATQRVV
ncbi:MAG TPA: polyprenyl synthetase family protein [Marmoricola sp.]|nr:polyprenyl synthetase family protein [Marmoricola sp.]